MATTTAGPAQPTPPPPQGPEPQAAGGGRSGRRLLWGAALALLLLLALLIGAGAWLWRSETAVTRLVPWVPGLTISGQQGRPTGGPFSVQRLHWQGGNLQIIVEDLAWDDAQWSWRPHAGTWSGVRLTLPRATRVQVLTTPDAAGTAPSTGAPAHLQLGLEVQAPGLRIERLEFDEQPPFTDFAADVHLGAARGAEHRFENLTLRREGLVLSGQAVIGTRDGLPVQARLNLEPTAPAVPAARSVALPAIPPAIPSARPSASRPASPPASPSAMPPATPRADARSQPSATASPAWQAELQVTGPLARLVLEAQLKQATGIDPDEGATATVQATLAPFAAWPLLALAAQAEGLDLSSLAPGLPQTALSGRALLADPQATQGLQDPLVFDIDLENAQPGPWDANRLPLRRLQVLLQGSPADPATLVFDRFVAELAGTQPAGRIEGQGRLHQGSLVLELALADVRPEQLATIAPPMRLGGTLGVAVDGLPGAPAPSFPTTAQPAAPRTVQARVQVDLTGRLARASTPPLRLQALASVTMPPDGTLSASLRELRASTGTGASTGTIGGLATGEASAERNAAGDWRLQTSGALARFDPGPWWPAARLGRGAQSLNARWQADLTHLAGAARTPAGTTASTTTGTAARRAAASSVPASPWPQLRGSASLVIAESRLADLTWRGNLALQAAADALQLRADLRAGANRFQVDGRLPHARGRAAAVPTFALDVQAPALAALAPLAGLLPAPARAWWPREGSLSAQASAQGQWPDLKSEGSLDARGLRSPQLSVGRAQARWNLAADSASAPMLFDLQASDIASGVQRVDELVARLQGTPGEHRLSLRASSPVRPPAWADAVSGMATQGGSTLQLEAAGRWIPVRPGAGVAAGGVWRGQIERLRAAPRSAPASPWLAAEELSLTLTLAAGGQPRQAVLAPGRVAAFGGALNWQRATWQAGAEPGSAPRIELQAQLEPLAVAPLLARLQPQFGWRGDLALAGRIALTRAERLDAEIQIERTGGDLSLTVEGATRALEISDLRIGLVARDGLWQATQALVGRNVGVVGGLQTVQTTQETLWPEAGARLEGGLSLIVPELQVWAPWLPPGWRLGGELQLGASLGGTFGQPEYRGTIIGAALSVRNLFEGIHLTQGTLDVVLDGNTATLRQVEFRDGAGEGRLRASGSVNFSDGVTADLRLATEQLRLLDRYDRRITTTGAADIGVRGQGLTVRGSFTIDEGLVDATQADAPRPSSDVVVVNRAPLRPATDAAAGAPRATATMAAATAPDVELRIDLGRALRLRGRGLDTLLRGQLRISTPGGQLAVNGVVRAEEGTYSAYGQNLRIERGNLIFSGEVATPTLDILALRGDIDERVGVVVSGTAVNPRVRLYSEPARDEFDTLTWLVLGRAPEGLGRDDSALLQRAALALLAGNREGDGGFLQRLGLDEMSISRGGAGGADDTIITLGRQISRRVYVGYEQSLGSAGGTLQLIYRVANRITLRARTGAENAVDVIWTWRWN